MDSFSAAELADVARVVHWPGPRNDVPLVLAASDLFVLPSYMREGIPRVLLEAAAMGLPLVTTDTPGCNDVVEEGVNGHLVPPRDPAALAAAIERLLDQPQQCRAFGRCSRERAVERFDLSVVVDATRDCYTQLLARKTTQAQAAAVADAASVGVAGADAGSVGHGRVCLAAPVAGGAAAVADAASVGVARADAGSVGHGRFGHGRVGHGRVCLANPVAGGAA